LKLLNLFIEDHSSNISFYINVGEEEEEEEKKRNRATDVKTYNYT